MKKLVMIALALSLVSGILLAQHHPMMKQMPDKPMMKHQMGKAMMMDCMDDLNLTPAQQKKFEELRTAFRKTENSVGAEIENLRMDFHAAMKAENFGKAKDIHKQISAKESMLAEARIDFMAARMKELSSEQKEAMKANMKQFMMNKPPMQGMNGCMGMGNGMGMHKQGNCFGCDDKEAPGKMKQPCNDCDSHKSMK